jgi:hypothetical protein
VRQRLPSEKPSVWKLALATTGRTAGAQTLDKMLAEVDRNEMKALASREDMFLSHADLGFREREFPLGTGLRIGWGLWGGSRLQKYFSDRGVEHSDDMVRIILSYYYDWLHGDIEGWKNWEKEWHTRIPHAPAPPPPPAKKRRE